MVSHYSAFTLFFFFYVYPYFPLYVPFCTAHFDLYFSFYSLLCSLFTYIYYFGITFLLSTMRGHYTAIHKEMMFAFLCVFVSVPFWRYFPTYTSTVFVSFFAFHSLTLFMPTHCWFTLIVTLFIFINSFLITHL